MKRVLLIGCGGCSGIGFSRCLRSSSEKFFLLGAECDEVFIYLVEADKKVLIPPPDSIDYMHIINKLVEKYSIGLVIPQRDSDIEKLTKTKINAKLFLPKMETIEICQNKFETNKLLERNRICVAKTIFINNIDNLKTAFKEIGSPIWVRALKGSEGKGCFLANKIEEAKVWIDLNNGWGNFIASEYLPEKNYGCDLLFNDGKLICSQTKIRLRYVLHKANPFGITGTTGFLKCVNKIQINKMAEEAIYSMDSKPHGAFSVDFKENKHKIPCVTEINAGRFLSSSLHLFHKSNFLLPYWYVKLAYGEKIPRIKKYNPLPEGLTLVRHVDVEPKIFMPTELKIIENYNKHDRRAF